MKLARLLNRNTVDVFIDTGSTSSVMPSRLAKQLDLDIMPSTIKIRLADNQVVPVIGETEEMEVCIDSISTKLKFLVMDTGPKGTTLIELDWFQQT